jgi:acyl carrier protein
MQLDIGGRIRKFIEDNYLFTEDSTSLGEVDSLLDAGLIDSTGILDLLGFLESEFGIQIMDVEVSPDNLDSISSITSYVRAKLAKPDEDIAPANEAGVDTLSH